MGKKICLCIMVLLINTIFLSAVVVPADSSVEQSSAIKNPLRTLLQNFYQRTNENSILSFLSSTIQTRCGSVEKTSTITFGLQNNIDVDDNQQTGIDGSDIRVQYFLLPWLTFDPELSIGVILTMRVERIGEEIKNQPFSLSSSISDGVLTLGYQSPEEDNNQIPEAMQLSAFVFIKPESKTNGLTLSMNPQYETSSTSHDLSLFSTYIQENVSSTYEFLFEPASEKQITIESTRQQNMLQFSILRDIGPPTIAKARIKRTIDDELVQTNFTIDPLPSDVIFQLALTPFKQGGGMIEYSAENDYDTTILLESNNIGICKYVQIQKIPKQFFVEWDPAKEQGYYHLNIESKGTDIRLLDNLENPAINLSIQGIKNVSFTAHWNFTNPGDFTVIKNTSFHLDLDFIIDVWEARIDAQPTAENIKVTWLTDVSGYLTYDTDWDPLSEIDILIKGSDLGIRMQGEFIKAEDWMIEWTIWPPVEWNLDTSGEIEFSSIIIDLFVEGSWLRLWPL
jgi:hypothetical protein